MDRVRAKKHLGQHFLTDKNIAEKIAHSLTGNNYNKTIEIGPGMGVLTQYLLKMPHETWVAEIDTESVEYLKTHYPNLSPRIIEGDFLKLNLNNYFTEPFAVIGNFPYNISSQILFKVLDFKENIPEVVGMFQKEVAERVASEKGNKTYGILSVLLQAYYNIEYLFTVHENVFNPPPKVKSGVIRLIRKENYSLDCNEKLFFRVVKTAFNQRRKTLRNALKTFNIEPEVSSAEIFNFRAEQLSVQQFVELTQLIEPQHEV